MWKNIKSLFVIEEEGDSKASKKQTAKSAPKKQKAPQAIPESRSGEPGKVSKKFMEVLLKAMEANNIEGFDYLEYKQSLNSLKNMPMDEKTRYQSALAMAQTMGVTPAKLIDTAQHYIRILQDEEKKFEQAVANQINTQIKSKEQEISKLEETIKAKAAKIKELTQQIEAHQKNQEKLKTEILDSSRKMESTKNNFIASYNSLVGQIQEDVENMQQYLK
ncbi:MAG: hypothetical protein MI974_07510 [Chitinophagales bacterium]|nr:hypothetical protein [Chitinophagales bacterium]